MKTDKEINDAVCVIFEALKDDDAAWEEFEAFCLSHSLMWKCPYCGETNNLPDDKCCGCCRLSKPPLVGEGRPVGPATLGETPP